MLKQVLPPFPAAVAKQVAGLVYFRSVPLLGLEELGKVFLYGDGAVGASRIVRVAIWQQSGFQMPVRGSQGVLCD